MARTEAVKHKGGLEPPGTFPRVGRCERCMRRESKFTQGALAGLSQGRRSLTGVKNESGTTNFRGRAPPQSSPGDSPRGALLMRISEALRYSAQKSSAET